MESKKHLVKYYVEVKKVIDFWLLQGGEESQEERLKDYFEENHDDFWFGEEEIEISRLKAYTSSSPAPYSDEFFFEFDEDKLEELSLNERLKVIEAVQEQFEQEEREKEFNERQCCLNFKEK